MQVEGPTAAALEYDPLGRLSRLTLSGNVTQFLYDGDALVAEYLNGALTRRYVHGDQVDEPLVLYTNGVVSTATRRFVHADHQGSVIAWSDSTGAAVQKNAYDPYGIPAPGNSGRFGYTGQTWIPELGLNHYKARIYSPRLGRFLQTDPIFYEDDFNLYAYVGGDPVTRRDPSGLFGQGDGWDKKSWEKFNAIQKSAATAMEKRADKLEAKADKLDAKNKDSGSVRTAAANLRAGAADLRSETKKANLVDGATMATINGSKCAGGAACAAIGGSTMWVNGDSKMWTTGGSQLNWLVGHESLHSGPGLNDLASTGTFSYKWGTLAEQTTFERLQGTPEGVTKPDNLMEIVYPNFGERNSDAGF